MIDRDFNDPHARRRDAHLHLQIPAVGHLRHAEPPQAIQPHRAHGRHIGESHPVDQTQQQIRDLARHDLLRRHAAALSPPSNARSHGEVGLVGGDQGGHRRQKARDVATVSIQEADDVAIGANARHPACAGAAVARDGFGKHRRAGGARALRGLVRRAIIDDHDLIEAFGRDLGDQRPDRLFLVEAGDHHAHHLQTSRKNHDVMFLRASRTGEVVAFRSLGGRQSSASGRTFCEIRLRCGRRGRRVFRRGE